MAIDHVVQMWGVRQVKGIRLRLVEDPGPEDENDDAYVGKAEALLRLLQNPAGPSEDAPRVRVMLNHRFELMNALVSLFIEQLDDLRDIDKPRGFVDVVFADLAGQIILRPRRDVLTIETPEGCVAELIDGVDIPVDEEFEEACWEMEFHPDAFKARAEREQAARDERKNQIAAIAEVDPRLALAIMNQSAPAVGSFQIKFENGAHETPDYDVPPGGPFLQWPPGDGSTTEKA